MSVLSPVAGESREGMDRALQTIEEEIEDLIINHNVPSENIVSCSWYISASGRSTDNLVCTVL